MKPDVEALHGESKLDSMAALDFLGLVLAKLTHDVVSLRFLLFAMVGTIGLVRASCGALPCAGIFNEPFRSTPRAAARCCAMTTNFISTISSPIATSA